jgi:photosystem II Psb27 protein
MRFFMRFLWHLALTIVFVSSCYFGVFQVNPQPSQAGLLGNRSQKVMTTKEIREQVNAGLTGDYESDTKAVIDSLRYAVTLPPTAPDRDQAESDAHFKINAYSARYRINSEKASLYSYTTMRTLVNNLAAYYNGSTRKSVPQKTKDRVLLEMDRVESALNQGR